MNIENLFEDLEAQFENSNSIRKQLINFDDVNLAIVKTEYSNSMKLIAPIVAIDFIAGLDLLAPTWHIFPFHAMRAIKFEREASDDLPKLRRIDKTLLEFLAASPMPSPAKWRLLGACDHQKVGQLAGLEGSLVGLVDSSEGSLIAVPWQSIQQLSIESVDKLNGDF